MDSSSQDAVGGRGSLPTPPADTRTILERAAFLVRGGWTQGAFEHDGCFCARGAIGAAAGVAPRLGHHESELALAEVITGRLAKDIPGDPIAWAGCKIVQWNDAPGRTQAEVVEALERAAALQPSTDTSRGEAVGPSSTTAPIRHAV